MIKSDEFFVELAKIIDMPKHCKSFTIHAKSAKEPIIIDSECFLYPGTSNVDTITKRYKLVECEEPVDADV